MIYPEMFGCWLLLVVICWHRGLSCFCSYGNENSSLDFITLKLLDQPSCNPSIGGIGKGQLIKEIDALGGAMGICADKAAINIKILIVGGPATYGTYVVLYRQLYRQEIRKMVENQPNLFCFPTSS